MRAQLTRNATPADELLDGQGRAELARSDRLLRHDRDARRESGSPQTCQVQRLTQRTTPKPGLERRRTRDDGHVR